MEDSTIAQPAPYTAVQIANEFIARGVEDGIQDMTNMKIQKLVYFTQGFFLAIYDRPLIQEDFFVWKHGPVVRQLYKTFKDIIDRQENWGTRHCFDEPLREQDGSISQVNPEDADAVSVINSVWDACKNYTASYLRLMTCKPNSPWSVVFDKEGLKARIPDVETTNYFKALMKAD